MNQLVTMSYAQTMTSKEIAELSSRTHSSVLRSIDTLVQSLSDADLHRGFESTTYVDSNGQEQRMYCMDKNSTLCLVTGYDAVARMRIIERWQELEVQQQQALPQTHIEAVRAYLVTLETVEAQSKQLGIQAEVIQHKRIITNDGTNDFTIARIKELNPDMKFSGQLLNRESDDQELPATKQFGMGKVNTPYSYHREVWEAVYPNAILPD